MSLNRYAKRRDKNESTIVEALRKAGCDVHQIDEPVDLIVGKSGRTVLMEVKGRGGKLTKNQCDFFALYRGEAYVVRTASAALKIMEVDDED